MFQLFCTPSLVVPRHDEGHDSRHDKQQFFLVSSVVVFTVAGVVVIFAASSAVAVSAVVVVSRVVVSILSILLCDGPGRRSRVCAEGAQRLVDFSALLLLIVRLLDVTVRDAAGVLGPGQVDKPDGKTRSLTCSIWRRACDRLLARWTFELPVARLTVNDFTVNHV
ncbi:hypothetical protein H257_08803 [Aphanomyces astaci]|uniref:Uncharacterized protein n=1 Tax=Aphanomyces astaci TaxID=112090 RepID=W4GDL4_APHAT|nr:hypothetical protein H257_08803 [Aphanomyces astaci]ETV77366.1 hypothetical protein H257_08803 [Aphanomyces astaci]|eukprot:XP_009833153.1 hypothetical protein H257_08803 [Aphanomyces astaci]